MVTTGSLLDAPPTSRVPVASGAGVETRPALGAGPVLVLVALAYAVIAQGAYYPSGLRLVTVFVVAGLVATWARTGAQRLDLGAPTVAAGALAAWYLGAGLAAHHLAGAVPAVELLVALAGIVAIVRRTDAVERRLIAGALLGVGVVLALAGWQGVAWRQSPRALLDGGLWRAASTITYANATAGCLAALALLALGWLVTTDTHTRVLAGTSYVLVVGLLATASRAGVLAFGVGLVWLAVVSRRAHLWRALPVFVGAAIASAGLLPSMVASQPARPAFAMGALVVGALVVIAPVRVAAGIGLVAVLGLAAVPGARGHVTSAVSHLRADRATVSSPDRTNELHAALRLARAHPVTGAGPGRVDLTWEAPVPVAATMHVAYAHDEYLQVVDEAGLPALLLLAAGVTAVAFAIRRARSLTRASATTGAVAALVALAVHSGFDFLWHVPIVPLVAAVVVGLVLPSSPVPTHGRVHR